MSIRAPIQPSYGSGVVTVLGAAGTATVVIAAAAKQVILTNQGANVAYARVGVAATTATTADYPVPAGAQVVVSKGDGEVNLTLLSPAGTTIHSMTGEGF